MQCFGLKPKHNKQDGKTKNQEKSKGQQTQTFIVETSTRLFAEKGYAAVNMKDICQACEMSRGGVYRYFSSPKDIFIKMLDMDYEKNRDIVSACIENEVPALNILEAYFMQEITAIRSEQRGLYFAIHEFAFAEPDQRFRMNERVDDGLKILERIFEYGHKRGEFKSFDVHAVAVHMIYFMDSLKTSSAILDIEDEQLEKQLDLLRSLVI